MQLLNDAIKKWPMVLQIAIMTIAARSGSPHNVLVLQIAIKNEVNRFLCTCTKHVSLHIIIIILPPHLSLIFHCLSFSHNLSLHSSLSPSLPPSQLTQIATHTNLVVTRRMGMMKHSSSPLKASATRHRDSPACSTNSPQVVL